jgi:hypothetical protein
MLQPTVLPTSKKLRIKGRIGCLAVGSHSHIVSTSSEGSTYSKMASFSFTPPKSYTAYAFMQPGGKLEKITVNWKAPKEGEVVLKVLACGVCGR